MEEQIAELQKQITELKAKLTVAEEKASKTDELVTNARQSEKDKLYGEINQLKQQLATSEATLKTANESLEQIKKDNGTGTEKVTALEQELAKANEKIAELQKVVEGGNGVDNETLKKMQEDQAQLLADLKAQKDELAQFKAQKEADDKAKELKTYRNTKLRDLDEEFHSLVVGSSKEEIDASYASAVAARDAFMKKYGVGRANPSLLGDNDVFKNVTATDIASMTDEQYAQFRKEKLGFK